MKPNRGKPLSGSQVPSSETLRPIGSHDVTLDSTSQVLLENPRSLDEVRSSEYHLTVRVNNSSLSRRQLSLLLEVLCYQIVYFGSNLSMLLALYELYSRLLGNARFAEEVSDVKIRMVLTISEILIGALREKELNLYSNEYTMISKELRDLLKSYLMSKRTYGSRYRSWRPEKLLTVRTVPVSTLFERTTSNSKRYSGYTKGYGESHGNAHKSKTNPSMELDGETNRPDKEERNLILRMTDVLHQRVNQLWIKFKNLSE